MKRLLIVALMMFCVGRADAYPMDGWYWNPNESGRGLNIELQDDLMFISFFHYDNAGNPIWWVASGRYNEQTNRVVGDFYRTRNGQCPGCSPRTPDVDFNFDGDFVLTFDSDVSATLDWAGGRTRLIRQYWAFDLSDPLSYAYGDFHLTTGALGVYFGNRLRFFEEYRDGSDVYLRGQVIGGSSSRIALVSFSEDIGWFALVDSSSSFYTAYAFGMTKDRLIGRSWTYRKNESLDGNGLELIGHRTASKTHAVRGNGPRVLSLSDPKSELNDFAVLNDQARHELERVKSIGVSSKTADAASISAQLKAELTQMQAVIESIQADGEAVK